MFTSLEALAVTVHVRVMTGIRTGVAKRLRLRDSVPPMHGQSSHE